MRRRTAVAVVLLVGLVAAGAYMVWTHPRFSNWLDEERADAAALAALATAPLPARPAGSDWPQWRGPNRDGRAPAGAVNADWATKPPAVLWSVPCGGGYSCPAVVDGKLYLTEYDPAAKAEHVRCLDADTGKELWRHTEPAAYTALRNGYAGGPRASPTVHDGRLYFLTADGKFVCLSLAGKPAAEWSHDLVAEFRADTPTWGFASSPLIEGDLVIVQPGGKGGSVAAFDRKTGETKWTAGRNPNGYSSPVAATLAGRRQVVAVTGDAILGIRPDNGDVLWSHPWVTEHRANIASPVLAGDYVFVGSNYSKGCVLLEVRPDGVREVYFKKNKVLATHIMTAVERDGFLFGYHGHNQHCELRCVNLRTGEVVAGWEALDPSARPVKHGSLTLAGDNLLGLTEDGTLFLADADPAAFRLRGWQPGVLAGRECWAPPVVVAGRAFVRDAATLACVDLRP